MDYHNVSCQTLMLQYFKDTLRYVKLFGALKSILKHGGVAVPDSKAGALHQHRLPAAESKPAPDGWEWRGGPEGPRQAQCSSEEAACPVTAPCTAGPGCYTAQLVAGCLGTSAPLGDYEPGTWGQGDRGHPESVMNPNSAAGSQPAGLYGRNPGEPPHCFAPSRVQAGN